MKNILKKDGVQTLVSSIICIILGIVVGFITLLIIKPSGAIEGITSILKNFLNFKKSHFRIKYLGSTLTSTAPLIMCSLSILFSYKVGIFNIGCPGQYTVGVMVSLYCALVLKCGWFVCMCAAAVAGAIFASIVAILKIYRNVNEIISGIMLNWIALYITNIVLSSKRESSSSYTISLTDNNDKALFPNLGLKDVFCGNKYVSLAIIFSIIAAIIIWVLLKKTKYGFELCVIGYNKNAAKYVGIAEKRNIVTALMISGALAGLAASFIYQTDMSQWDINSSTIPQMGFQGIASAFLGGLDPIGVIFSSFFIRQITHGSGYLDLNKYSSQVGDLIVGIIIYFSGFVSIFKYWMKKKLIQVDIDEEIKEKNTKGVRCR